jgi:hypothetical protein
VCADRSLRTLRREVLEASTSGSAARRVTRQLEQVHQYMSKNMNDLLDRGATLESVAASSSKLLDSSKTLKYKSKEARIWAQFYQYWPLTAGVALVLLLVYFVFFF